MKHATCFKTNSRNFVLNNAIDVLNPLDSSKYFKNPKIIIVTRDPRDVFFSMKRVALASSNYSVKIFVEWYKHYFGSINFKKILRNKKILHIKFENFITNFEYENERLCKFIELKKICFKKNCIFDLNKSSKKYC